MLDFTIALAKNVGALLREQFGRPRQIEYKGPTDLVTEMDRRSEALIVEALTQQFPDHSIVGEEGSAVAGDSGFTWLIDPLDGTNNYTHGYPVFCVSLGLLKEGEPYLGVIYDPLRDELFSAERGRGAHLNNMPIHVSSVPTLSRAMTSTGFPYNFATTSANNAREFALVHAQVQGVRRSGSAAIDLAYVAMGRAEVHWELQLKPWDSGAAAVIVSEAGGRISEWNGAPWSPWSPTMIASNGLVHDELVATIAPERTL